MNIEIRHLRYFLEVSETLHFGQAAQNLGMAQPPLSQAIRQLEEELGVRLFERSTRHVILSTAGRALLPEAQRLYGAYNGWLRHAQCIGRGERGPLRVGFVSAAMDGKLPAAIRNFRGRRPKVDLSLRLMDSEAQLKALRSGHIDLGVMRAFGYNLHDLQVHTYQRERYIFGLPSKHPLAKRKRAATADLRGEPFIMLPRWQQPALRTALENALTVDAVTPNIVQDADIEATAVALAAASVGIAVVPESSRIHARPGVTFVSGPKQLPAAEFDAVHRKNESLAVLQILLEELLKQPTD